MFEEFVEYALPRDYANNGDLNLTNFDVIRETYETFFAKYNYAPNTYYSLLDTQVFFRNRRYEVILDYMNRNFPIEITLKMTKISPKMVRDIYNNKEKALKFLRQEERNNAET